MTAWSAASLKPGYAKRIVGFDLRIVTASKQRASNIVCQHWTIPPVATVDSVVWSKVASAGYEDERNGINLIDASLNHLYDGVTPTNCSLVAFDLPATLAEELSQTFGLRLLESDRVFSSPRWKHLGYDIADIRTQSSALYSFDWTREELVGILNVVPCTLNDWGIINEEDAAILACLRFDEAIREHAPFSPCGVWLAQQA